MIVRHAQTFIALSTRGEYLTGLCSCLDRSSEGGRDSIKVKVKLSLCLTKHHTMKIYGGVEV
jgi:hypothetical protein